MPSKGVRALPTECRAERSAFSLVTGVSCQSRKKKIRRANNRLPRRASALCLLTSFRERETSPLQHHLSRDAETL